MAPEGIFLTLEHIFSLFHCHLTEIVALNPDVLVGNIITNNNLQ